jgi:rubredoxin
LARLKCKKCGAVFEYKPGLSFVHAGPYKTVTCPACKKTSFMNTSNKVNEPLTWPPEEKQQPVAEPRLTEEELEKKRIDDSKYEKP